MACSLTPSFEVLLQNLKVRFQVAKLLICARVLQLDVFECLHCHVLPGCLPLICPPHNELDK